MATTGTPAAFSFFTTAARSGLRSESIRVTWAPSLLRSSITEASENRLVRRERSSSQANVKRGCCMAVPPPTLSTSPAPGCPSSLDFLITSHVRPRRSPGPILISKAGNDTTRPIHVRAVLFAELVEHHPLLAWHPQQV